MSIDSGAEALPRKNRRVAKRNVEGDISPGLRLKPGPVPVADQRDCDSSRHPACGALPGLQVGARVVVPECAPPCHSTLRFAGPRPATRESGYSPGGPFRNLTEVLPRVQTASLASAWTDSDRQW